MIRLPWSKPKPDVEALRVAALREGLQQGREEGKVAGRKEALAEVERAVSGLAPVPAVAPPANSPRHPLYAFDRPIWYATPQPPTRRPGASVSVDTLRALADNYDVLRACINHLKREAAAVPIEISPRDAKDKTDATKARLLEARACFDRSGCVGGVGKRRAAFEGMVIEDLCVVGSAAVFHDRNLGGGVRESVAIDAATIRPVTDAWGWSDPERAYEQWVYGLKVATFSERDLTYEGIWNVSYSPYPKSPVEWLLLTITAALKADEWNREWLTHGNTPSDLLAMPEQWTSGQVMEYAQYFDAILSGNSRERSKTKFVPGGTERLGGNTRKDQEFSAFELWLLRRTCAILGVSPASIGFAGEQYKVSQEASMDGTSEFGVGVLLDFRKALYDDVLERLGYADFECHNVTEREEKAKDRAETNAVLIQSGQRSINECRKEDGVDPIEGGDVALVPTTVQPLDRALNPPEPAPAPGAAKPPTRPAAGQEQ